MLRLIVVAGVLQDNQRVVLLRCDHDLVLLRADADELHVLLGVERLDGLLRLVCELRDQRAILNGVVLTHGAANGDASRVHHDDALHTLVSVDAVDCLLYLL